MIRGTTPTLTFALPMDTSTLKEIYVTIAQDDETVIERAKEEMTCEGKTATLKLTQEETLKLDAHRRAEIQIRVLTEDDAALVSDIYREDVGKILKDGVI